MKHMWTVQFVSGVLIAVLLVAAQPVRADNHIAVLATGDTLVTTSTCDATTGGSVPTSLDVDEGDWLFFWYNHTWEDTRPLQSAPATHNFTMIIIYTVYTGDVVYYHQFSTEGGIGGFSNPMFRIEVGDLPGSVYVYWHARITSTNPSCSDFDSEQGSISLY